MARLKANDYAKRAAKKALPDLERVYELAAGLTGEDKNALADAMAVLRRVGGING